jgi:hypothetical protein
MTAEPAEESNERQKYNELDEFHQYHQFLHEALQWNQIQEQLQKHQAQH